MERENIVSKPGSTRTLPILITLRKLLVSGFVVFSFVAYAVHDRLVNADLAAAAPASEGGASDLLLTTSRDVPVAKPPVPASQGAAAALEQVASTQQQIIVPTATPLVPTATTIPPSATPKPQGQYADGVYTGPTVDVFYGLVQVQATVQGGRLADVQFLQYPNDRRTSQQINRIAIPYLTQEAIQAQSAYVNIISGATLTSEGFAQSLYSALNQAKSQF